MKTIYCFKHDKYKNFKKSLKYHIFSIKLVLSFIYDKCGGKDEKIKEEESIEILKLLDLVKNMEEYKRNI